MHNHTGQRFGLLTVIQRDGKRGGRIAWECRCDCGKIAVVSGKHLRNGDTRSCGCRARRHPEVPLEAMYAVDDTTGCWNWLRAISRNGYGNKALWAGGGQAKWIVAHRYVYERLRGTIPEAMTLDHLCRNRKCVNPDHLEAVTHAENNRRASAILTIADVLELRDKYKEPRSRRYHGVTIESLALKYGVAIRTVKGVIYGESWKDVASANL